MATKMPISLKKNERKSNELNKKKNNLNLRLKNTKKKKIAEFAKTPN